MKGRPGGEYQPLHNRLDALSFEWRKIPVLPDAIRRYRDIIEHPNDHSFVVNHFSGEVISGVLEDPLELLYASIHYNLSPLQSPAQQQKSQDFFTVTFDLDLLRNIKLGESITDATPHLSIERTPQDIDGILDQTGKGLIVANYLTDGNAESGEDDPLREVVSNFFVSFFKTKRYPIAPHYSLNGVQLALNLSPESIAREDDPASISEVEGMINLIPKLTPDNFSKIEISDIYVRDGELIKKDK